MRKLIFSLLLLYSSSVLAIESDLPPETDLTSVQINQLFDLKNVIPKTGILDLVAKEEKVSVCISRYVEQQGKSYAKIPQADLYDLIHNFGKIVSRISGKKPAKDNIPYEEKIEALARVQCEAYYALGVLK